MKKRADPELSRYFKRTILIAAIMAFLLALCLVGLYYGCAKASHPGRPTSTPPSGLQSLYLEVLR